MKLYDLTQPIGVSTLPWPTFKPFKLKNSKDYLLKELMARL